jgi:ATP-dependent helicase/DNAse subunit B
VQLGTFEELPARAPNEETKRDDASFFIVSAASRDNEVEEILREVLYPSSTRCRVTPETPGKTAVLMRESVNYLALIHAEWSRTGITSYVHHRRSLGESPSGGALRSLVKLLDGAFRRSDVMEFLQSTSLRRPAWFPEDLPEVPVAEWNHFALKAQIIAGEQAWRDNLNRLQNQFKEELARRESEMDDPTAPLQRQWSSLAVFAQYIDHLFAGVAAVRSAKTWGMIGQQTRAMLIELLEETAELQTIHLQLAQSAQLDAFGLRPDVNELASFVESILSQPLAREGRFEINEPTVATISEAFGVVFDDVILCGLVEKEFPHHSVQDPLLLDDERRYLQFVIGNPELQIPLRGRRQYRERFLFRTALNSARRRVVLTYPRLDPVEGREWLASAFLLRALEAATGSAADYQSLETFVRTSPQARRVSVNRLQGRDAERSVTAFQYDLASLGKALQAKRPDEVAYLFCADEQFQRGVFAEKQRYRTQEFTPYDGSVENGELRRRLSDRLASLSAARMQRYARCPYQYFAHQVLELEAAPEPQWIQPLAPRLRGIFMRHVLDRFFREEVQAGHWPLTEDALERLSRTTQTSFDDFEQRQVTGLPLLWDIDKNRITRRLNALIGMETSLASASRPRYFNVTYGLPPGDPQISRREPLMLTTEGGLTMQFRGTVDRVDMDGQGVARVVSYTTKRAEHLKRDDKHVVPLIEEHVARLAATAMGLDVGEFEYLLLTTDDAEVTSFSKAEWDRLRAEVSRVMETIASGIAGGQFFPSPNDHCRYCQVKAACGTGRFTHKWDYDMPQTAALRVLRGGAA